MHDARAAVFFARGQGLFFFDLLDAVLLVETLDASRGVDEFCFPVKKGWQDEQISTWMFFTVERVSMTLPQAHVMVVSSYLGWIPLFMTKPPAMPNA